VEQVFTVRRTDFFGGRWPQGFVRLSEHDGAELVADFERRGSFVDRDEAERTPALKQPIPYCLVSRPGELLRVQRLKRQSEGRLHGLYSVGLGGHVNPQDAARHGSGPIEAALRRELSEELIIPQLDGQRPRLLGLLNDDSTEVGSVHVGLVYLLELAAHTTVGIREIGKMRGRFAPLGDVAQPGRVVEPESLWHDSHGFESWSAIMLEARPWAFPGASEGSEHGVVSREESHDG
jgi:predicted NUDIX family phosphoesterase